MDPRYVKPWDPATPQHNFKLPDPSQVALLARQGRPRFTTAVVQNSTTRNLGGRFKEHHTHW